jgi:hypothetical protein
MRVFEVVMASILGLFGLRSLLYWARRPLAEATIREHALYAVWTTARVGLWFAAAGVFVISALLRGRGTLFMESFAGYRWYVFVPLGLAIAHLLAGIALGRGRES